MKIIAPAGKFVVCSIFSSAANLSVERPLQESAPCSMLAGLETTAMPEARRALFGRLGHTGKTGAAVRVAITGLAIVVLPWLLVVFQPATRASRGPQSC